MLNQEDSGVILQNEGNIIDLSTKTAKVEFKRPLVVEATETMDFQATYRGYDYLLYLSYSYQASDTASNEGAIQGENDGGRSPKFYTITLKKPSLPTQSSAVAILKEKVI